MYIDTKLAIEYCGNSEKIFKNLVIKFLNKYKNHIDKIKNLSGDEFQIEIHQVKGLSYNIGSKKLYDLCLLQETNDILLDEYIEIFNNVYKELLIMNE